MRNHLLISQTRFYQMAQIITLDFFDFSRIITLDNFIIFGIKHRNTSLYNLSQFES